MGNLKHDIEQAISDFGNVKVACEESGVEVPYDTNTSEYGDKVRQVYRKGVNDGIATNFVLEPATKTKLGGIIIGDNLTAQSDGTTTVRTAEKIAYDNKLPAKSSDVYKSIDEAYLTNEEIDNLLQNFN